MDIDCPDEAVVYYKKALKELNDPVIMRDLGRALVKTHDYKHALSYYIDSLKDYSQNINPNNILTFYEIAHDFVNIMLKLSGTDTNKNSNLKTHLQGYIDKLSEDVKKNEDYQLRKKLSSFKFIMAKVLKNLYIETKSVSSSEIYKSLEESLKLCKEVCARLRELKNEILLKDEKEFLSDICYEIGKYYETIEPQPDFCEKAYQEALNNFTNNEK